MKADVIIFAKVAEELKDFLTNCYSYGIFKTYVCQLVNGTVEVGHAGIPKYAELPHKNLGVCWAIDRLLKNESECYPECNHVIIGERLPRTIIKSSCYYCGDSTSDAYF